MVTFKDQDFQAAPEYAAIVYQSGLYTTAVDKNGVVLSSSLISDYRDDIPIQAAITYAGNTPVYGYVGRSRGKVRIASGIYAVSATSSQILMEWGVEVVGDGTNITIINIRGDVDVIKMFNRARWEKCYFQVASSVGTYTHAIFTFDGTTLWNLDNTGGISDCFFDNTCTTAGGTAIWFKCENTGTTDNSIYCNRIERINMKGLFNYGIYFTSGAQTNQYKTGFIWNHFKDITFWGLIYPIYQYMPAGAYYCSFNSNTFQNMQININTGRTDSRGIVLDNASTNYFLDIRFSDFATANGYEIILGARSVTNYFDVTSASASNILDEGGNNVFHSRLSSEKIQQVLDCNNCNVATTNPAVIATTEMGTNGFPLKHAIFQKGASREVEHLFWMTPCDPAWDYGSRLPNEYGTYTADDVGGTTDATNTYCATITTTLTDYYRGWTIFNVTLGLSSVITASVAGHLTHGSISGNDATNTFFLLSPFGKMTAQIECTIVTGLGTSEVASWNLYARRFYSTYAYTGALYLVASVHCHPKNAYSVYTTEVSTPFHIPGGGNMILWELHRDNSATDTLDQSALFLALKLRYNVGSGS
jgi:hypothetical protein